MATGRRATTSIFIAVAALCNTALCAFPAGAQSESVTQTRTVDFLGPNTIADLAVAAGPSVVNIVSTATAGRAIRYKRGREEQSRRTRQYFGLDPDTDGGSELKITGSGVVVRADGYILTSLHVVNSARDITVTLADGRTFEGKVIGRDNFTDLALLKIEATKLQEAKFGSANALRVGEWVVAIGNQFGLENTVTCGLVSGLAREAKAFTPSFGARTGAVRFIQTQTPINPGSSGGPLLNLKGEVVGINSFIRDDAQNIGFAIPAHLAREVADKLMRSGTIQHPYIGIEMRDPAEIASTETFEGVEVTSVKPSSPASLAGLETGDMIVEVDKSLVKSPTEVSQAVSSHSIGEKMTFKVKRRGADHTVVVRVDKLPEEVE